MSSLRCATCGFLNFASATFCKRCRAMFDQGAGTSQPVYFQPAPNPNGPVAAHWPQQTFQPFYFPAPVAPLPRPSKYGATNAFLWTLLGLSVMIGLGLAFFWNVGKLRSPDYVWQEYRSLDSSYTVLMPARPLESVETESDLGVDLKLYMATASMGRRGEFMAGYIDYPTVRQGVTADEVLDAGANGAVTNSGATLLSKKKITLDGYPGLEVELKPPEHERYRDGRIVARIYWAPPRLYMAFAAGSSSPTLDAELAKFLDSFRLLKNSGR